MTGEEAIAKYKKGESLRDANLYGADLHGANLCGADLRGADLRGANLWNCFGAPLTIHAGRYTIQVNNGKVQIGCYTKTTQEWLESYDELGAKHHYPLELIRLYGALLRVIAQLEPAEGSN